MRWIQIDGELVEVDPGYRPPRVAPAVWGDLPDYTSPVDGKLVSGRRQRRNDLARNRCRPWEGMAQERKEADRQRRYLDQKMDKHLEESARKAFYQIDAPKRRVLE